MRLLPPDETSDLYMTDARKALKYVHGLKYSCQPAEPNPPTSSTSVKDISVRRSVQSTVTCRLRRHMQTVLDIRAEAAVKRVRTTGTQQVLYCDRFFSAKTPYDGSCDS